MILPSRRSQVSAVLTAALVASLTPSFLAAQASNQASRAPVNPSYLKYLATRGSSEGVAATAHVTPDGHGLGLIPPQFKVPAPAAAGSNLAVMTTLPASFDLRSTTPVGVPPVRDQLQCGSCWTFGSLASLESNFLYRGYGTSVDYSEADLNENNNYDIAPCMGGNWVMATGYLSRWAGPLQEVDAPYPTWFAEQGNEPGAESQTEPMAIETALSGGTAASGSPALQVHNVIWYSQHANPLTSADITTVKQAVAQNGALTINVCWDNEFFNAASNSFYCNETFETNHEIAIVGWNDNYPASNFLVNPGSNGAFIVRNSWGSSWGDGGYFYMSYQDASLEIGAQFLVSPTSAAYDRIYQYDRIGVGDFWGFGSNTAWMANEFVASSHAQKISAVGFYTPVAGTPYQIEIHEAPTPGQSPRTGTLLRLASGNLTTAGYHTIPIVPVTVTGGRPFSVVVKVITHGYNYPMAVQDSAAGISAGQGCPGMSAWSPDGLTWDWGMSGETGRLVMCLKAYASAQ